MKGLLYYGNKDIRYSEDIEEPQIVNANDVKIKVAFCGICGTDLHEFLDGPIFFPKSTADKDKISGLSLPLCPGHEFSGTVLEIGSDVTNVKPGDNVVVEATGHCIDRLRYKDTIQQDLPFCSSCKLGKPNCCDSLGFCGLGVGNGAMSEKVVYGSSHVIKIPDTLPLDIAALVEPLSVAWHAVEIANFKEGQTALVLGGGPIGLATILALKGHKAGKVICSEPALIRRQFAEKLGAQVFNPMDHKDDAIEVLKSFTEDNIGFDASFDCSGIKITYEQSIDALRTCGIAVNVAIWPNKPIAVNPMTLTYHEKVSTGSMCYVVKDFEQVIDALDKKLIDPEVAKHLITGKFNLRDGIAKGFQQLIDHKESNVKVLVTPDEV